MLVYVVVNRATIFKGLAFVTKLFVFTPPRTCLFHHVFARSIQYACVGTPVTRLCITHDDQFLLAADEASCLFVFDVRDRQDRGQAGSKLGGGELQPLAASEVPRTLLSLGLQNACSATLRQEGWYSGLKPEYAGRSKALFRSEVGSGSSVLRQPRQSIACLPLCN